MDGRSSAQMVSRGQMQLVRPPWHPSLHGMFAIAAVGMRAPVGYGAQRVIAQAAKDTSEKKNPPYHHW